MAARKILVDSDIGKYGIRITHNDNTCGWVVGDAGKLLLFKTQKAAQKALDEMKGDERYHWSCVAEVAKFTGFGRKND